VAFGDGLDDLGRQKRQPHDARYVPARNMFSPSDLADRPRPPASRSLDHRYARAVALSSGRSTRAAGMPSPSMGFVDKDEEDTLGIHGEFDGSIAASTRAIQKGGDYSGFYFSRGESYALSGAWAQALEDFDRANELSPQDPELLIRRAATLGHPGRPEEVLAGR
jgi:hypothetical protein